MANLSSTVTNLPSVTFSCPECGALTQASLLESAQVLTCHGCQTTLPLNPVHYSPAGQLDQCVACPSKELFLRKDFPQRLGVLIVSIGFVVSCYFWAKYQIMWAFGVLFASALIDVVLYVTIGTVLECYRCHAQYRGLAQVESYEPFDMEAFEKHRQQAIRLQEARSVAK